MAKTKHGAKVIGAIYHPPRPGLPFIAVIFSGSEIIETEVVFSESEGEKWVATILAGIKERLEQDHTRASE